MFQLHIWRSKETENKKIMDSEKTTWREEMIGIKECVNMWNSHKAIQNTEKNKKIENRKKSLSQTKKQQN
jgi:Zn ribbon nucleic-acid-binding protein